MDGMVEFVSRDRGRNGRKEGRKGKREGRRRLKRKRRIDGREGK